MAIGKSLAVEDKRYLGFPMPRELEYVSILYNQSVSLNATPAEKHTFTESGTYLIYFGFIGGGGFQNVYITTKSDYSNLRDCGVIGQNCIIQDVQAGDKIYIWCDASGTISRVYLGYIKL